MPINALVALFKHWKIIACVLGALLLYGYGYKNGSDTREAEWAAAVSRQRENNLKLNNEVSDALQSKYSALRRRYDDLIRLRPAGSLPAYDASGGRDGEARANGLSGELYTSFATLMFQADLQTQQLIACQNWIKANK